MADDRYHLEFEVVCGDCGERCPKTTNKLTAAAWVDQHEAHHEHLGHAKR